MSKLLVSLVAAANLSLTRKEELDRQMEGQ